MHRVLAGGVARPSLVRLKAGNRPQIHDVTMSRLAQERQARSGHPQQAEHVDLPHLDPILVAAFGDGRETARKTGVVDEHIDAAEFFLHLTDKCVDAASLVTSSGRARPDSPTTRRTRSNRRAPAAMR